MVHSASPLSSGKVHSLPEAIVEVVEGDTIVRGLRSVR